MLLVGRLAHTARLHQGAEPLSLWDELGLEGDGDFRVGECDKEALADDHLELRVHARIRILVELDHLHSKQVLADRDVHLASIHAQHLGDLVDQLIPGRARLGLARRCRCCSVSPLGLDRIEGLLDAFVMPSSKYP